MSGYLLDTNAVSELRKSKPNEGLVAWIEGTREDLLFISALTVGEIRLGIQSVVDSEKRRDLERWLLSDVRDRFGNRILSIDVDIADRWGRLEGSARATTGKLPAIDALLAATALHHDLDLVTRNVADFSRTPIRLINPWL